MCLCVCGVIERERERRDSGCVCNECEREKPPTGLVLVRGSLNF